MSYSYEYERPALTVDLVLLARPQEPGDLWKVLLVKRGKEPFAGQWALPGGFVNPGESTLQAALREIEEETGCLMAAENIEFLGLYDRPGRDPRGWVVSAAYVGIVDGPPPAVDGRDDAAEAAWKPLRPLSRWVYAFDHGTILVDAANWLRRPEHRRQPVIDPTRVPPALAPSDFPRPVRLRLTADFEPEVARTVPWRLALAMVRRAATLMGWRADLAIWDRRTDP